MAGTRQTLKGAVVVEYLKEHPKMPKRSLAKLLMKDHPKMFLDEESTRRLIRSYTGQNGNGSKQAMADRYGTRREPGVPGKDAWEEMMPESKAEDLLPWKVPTSVRKLSVLSDLHIPFHDVKALRMAISHCIAEKPDAILLNGDTMDFYAASFHETDPRLVDWIGELDAGRMTMRMIRTAFPNIPVYYKSGNHDIRLERHLMKHAPILLGMKEFELPTLLRMGELAIEHIENKRNIWAGKLNIIHGDEYKGSGGVNPARWLSLRTGENSLCAHFHRTSAHMDRTIRHDIRGWWSTGCLCELTPKWLPYNQWNSGFAIVHANSDESFEVENMTIVNGKVR